MDWRTWERFEQSRPIKAKGGIRAQTKRGTFGQSWWAKRWISVLEGFDLGSRLQRGRSYARQGQVLSIDIKEGSVEAKVQGSRATPYQVTIGTAQLSDANWRKVAEAVSSQAIFAAKLLAGEMPQDIEAVFQASGLSLFPERLRDLATDCSCPDWSNPCKHVAAVYYLLGEEFDRDPFLVFQLRGMPRDKFLGLLSNFTPPESPSEPEFPPEPLPANPSAFWSISLAPEIQGHTPQMLTGAALPRRLGNFPFWRGNANFLDEMDAIYRAAAAGVRDKLTRQ